MDDIIQQIADNQTYRLLEDDGIIETLFIDTAFYEVVFMSSIPSDSRDITFVKGLFTLLRSLVSRRYHLTDNGEINRTVADNIWFIFPIYNPIEMMVDQTISPMIDH